MNEAEWQDLVAKINVDVKGIIQSQRLIGEVHDELNLRAKRHVEEDYIFADAFGQHPGEARTINVGGVEVVIRLLHRRGLKQTDIKGADLLYEIAGRKFALVQYKITDLKNRVPKDPRQLETLISSCPNPCPPSRSWYWPTCGSWLGIHSPDDSSYQPACVGNVVFGDSVSQHFTRFSSGISFETFQHLFGRCWTGARLSSTDLAYFTWDAIQGDRVLFSVVQKGSFGR